MRSEAFAELHSLAFGVREALARRSRSVREAFARRWRGVGEAFGACVRKAGVRKRSKALGSVQRRSTKVGLSSISDGLGWPLAMG